MIWELRGQGEKGHEHSSEKGSDCDPSQLQPAECAERADDVSQSQVKSLNASARSVHAKLLHENHVSKISKFKINPEATQMIEVPAYSDHDAIHPSKMIVSNLGMHQVKPHMDRFTGKSAAVMNDRKVKLFKNRDS